MTKEMFEWITKWQRETFPQATPQSAANHLKEEVNELIHDLTYGRMLIAPSEYADCFLLLFGSASLFGMTYEQICHAINEKMEINKKRQWGKVNAQGYVKHRDIKIGDEVCLIEDSKKEPYVVIEITKKISNGPMGQFSPSPVIHVKDAKSRQWQFRKDSLELLNAGTQPD